MLDWFKTLYGREVEERAETNPPLEIPEGQSVEVVFLEPHVRVVQTSYGQRAVINVASGTQKYSLWLSRIALAREVALLEKRLGSLGNVKVRITNLGRVRRAYNYRVEQI